MTTTYERLRALKQRRADIASSNLRVFRAALEQAARVADQARQDSIEFSRNLTARQAALYDELEQKPRYVRELDDVREQVARLRRIEADLHAKAAEEERARLEAAAALDTARLGHQQAVKTLEKFDQLVAIEKREVTAEEQRNEDLEMEEFLRPAEIASESA